MVAVLPEITKLSMHLRDPQNTRMGRCLDHTGKTKLEIGASSNAICSVIPKDCKQAHVETFDAFDCPQLWTNHSSSRYTRSWSALLRYSWLGNTLIAEIAR